MSEGNGLTRRDFVKASSLAAAGVAFGSLWPTDVKAAGPGGKKFRFIHYTDVHVEPELDGERGGYRSKRGAGRRCSGVDRGSFLPVDVEECRAYGRQADTGRETLQDTPEEQRVAARGGGKDRQGHDLHGGSRQEHRSPADVFG